MPCLQPIFSYILYILKYKSPVFCLNCSFILLLDGSRRKNLYKVKCAQCIFSLSSTFISSVYMSAAILVMKLHDVIKQIHSHRQSWNSRTAAAAFSFRDYCSELISVAWQHSSRENWNEFWRKSSLRTCVTCIFSQTGKNEDTSSKEEGGKWRKEKKAN